MRADALEMQKKIPKRRKRWVPDADDGQASELGGRGQLLESLLEIDRTTLQFPAVGVPKARVQRAL